MDDRAEKLHWYTRQLYTKTGKMKLYSFFCEKNQPDKVRLKEELRQIKHLISDLEVQLDNQ